MQPAGSFQSSFTYSICVCLGEREKARKEVLDGSHKLCKSGGKMRNNEALYPARQSQEPSQKVEVNLEVVITSLCC